MDFPGKLCEASPYRAVLAIRYAVSAQAALCLLLPRGGQMSIQFQMFLPCIIQNDLSFTFRLTWPHLWWHLEFFFFFETYKQRKLHHRMT